MRREIAVSIGDADEKYCNDCDLLVIHSSAYCTAFPERPELEEEAIPKPGGTRFLQLRCEQCIDAELRKGEG